MTCEEMYTALLADAHRRSVTYPRLHIMDTSDSPLDLVLKWTHAHICEIELCARTVTLRLDETDRCLRPPR